MPIKLPETLPAFNILKQEGVMVMSDGDAQRQDIRPLHIGLLNLMPKKIQTETQFARLIGSTPLQIELDLIRMSEHESKNTSLEHIESFYQPFCKVKHKKYDGFIITGAPIEQLPFEEVTYWDELCEVMNWTQSNVHRSFGVCWGGMAMIYHFHGVKKHILNEKAFGCIKHQNLFPASPYLNGFSDEFVIPVSRWTEMKRTEIQAVEGLDILIDSEETGPCLVQDTHKNALYIFNHFEYDSITLKEEYDRDIINNTPIHIPQNYYPDDNPTKMPKNRWRSHAHLMYSNWINQIYQTTPFQRDAIGTGIDAIAPSLKP